MLPLVRHKILLFSTLFVISTNSFGATIYSRQTGTWTDVTSPGTWSTVGLGGTNCNCTPGTGDDVIIGSGNTVTFNAGAIVTINSLQINAGSTLTMTANFRLTVNTSIVLNGTINGASTANIEIAATAAGSTLSGTGTFSMSGGGDLKVLNDITIPAGSDIKFDALGKFRLNANTVTNNGKVQITNPSDITNTIGNVWINAASTSYLYYASNTNFGANNNLIATAVGNTVEFGMSAGTFNMDLIGSYYHLIISNAGKKRLKNNITVAGDLTINSGSGNELDLNFYNITLAGNLSNNGTFTPGVQSVTLNGNSAQQLSGATTFYDLIFNNSFATSPQITLGANIIVQNALTMTKGNVNLNGQTLTLGTAVATPGTLFYTAGFLYGNTGTFTRWVSAASTAIGAIASNETGHFPMGTSTGNYRPLWLTYSADLTAGGTVSVLHDPAALTTGASHIDASWNGGTTLEAVTNSFWTISSANGFTLNGATGSIRYGGQGYGTNTLSDLDATLLASTVGTYTAATNFNTAIEVNRAALTTATLANAWRIGTKSISSSPLPIELISFDAKLENDKVNLKWVTATEINNDYFTIERSNDGNNFQEIAKIKGAGNSSSMLNYSTADYSPLKGTSYYRLKQTDYDGKFNYFKIVPINNGGQELLSFTMFPNPAINKTVSINITGIQDKEILVLIYDMYGHKVYATTLLVENSTANTSIDFSNTLSRGTYLVTSSSGNQLYKQKLIIN